MELSNKLIDLGDEKITESEFQKRWDGEDELSIEERSQLLVSDLPGDEKEQIIDEICHSEGL